MRKKYSLVICLLIGIYSYGQNYYDEPNVLIDRINISLIDSTIRQNRNFAYSNHIKEIYSTVDTSFSYTEYYDEEGRIQSKKGRLGKDSYYSIEYQYNKENELIAFTKKYSNSNMPEITKIYYDEDNKVNRLERINFKDGSIFRTDSLLYYSNGKLKKFNNLNYFYDKNWNLTSEVYIHYNRKNDTTIRLFYNEAGCMYLYFAKAEYQYSIIADKDCRDLEIFVKRLGFKDVIQNPLKDFDRKILCTYINDKISEVNQYSFKKKLFHKKRELILTNTLKYDYYDTGLLKSYNDNSFYYKFYDKN